MDKNLAGKLNNLKKILSRLDSCLLAFSGGVDSTLLLRIAHDCLKDQVTALTADSPLYTPQELKFAKSFARGLKVKHLVIQSQELRNKQVSGNSIQRCYYCKRELFSKMKKIARKLGIKYVIDAVNSDDFKDFRPGLKAKKELGVISPLALAKLNKNDIYALSRAFNLPTKNKPSLACLGSRFPYGEKITAKKLFMVSSLEGLLRSLGVQQARVRHHGVIARIETDIPSQKIIEKKRTFIVNRARKLGYNYVTLDLEGYRTGSLNEVIRKRN